MTPTFSEFFDQGQEEHLSPFLTPKARKWAVHLALKGAILAGILLFFAYLSSWLQWSDSVSALLLLFVYLLAGIPALIESIEDLASFQVNIDVLMTLAAFGSVLIGSPLEGGLLLVLFSISGAMEETVTRKAKASISSLSKLSPSFANVLDSDGISIQKAVSEIRPGEIILVKAGDVVPLDGEVIEGTSSLNLVHLTGESVPVTKKPQEIVPAGGYNLDGALKVRVTHTSADSTLSKMVQLVQQAEEAKPKLQRWFDRLSDVYAKGIISLACLFSITFPYLLNIPFLGQEGSVYRSLAFLIAASPCALIIAIPIAYLSAISASAKKGIILKGGVILDALASCRTIAFDKTGTLTTGELVCLGFQSFGSPGHELKALSIALAVEQNATHPIAKAICDYALLQNVKPSPIDFFRSIPGYGLEAKIEETEVFLGNVEFIEPKLRDQDRQRLQREIEALHEQGELVALLLLGPELYIFRFQDHIRKGVSKTLDALRKEGYKLLMLTGDHEESANRVARELKIDEVYAHLKPEDKLNLVAQKAHTEGLVMCGDGVNDAPALARATVGISMGQVGSGTAIEAADVILMQDNIERLDWLMKKAKATRWIVHENLLLAALAILLASLPALLGFVPLWLAVLLHEGGTVLVGLNGLRLLKK